MADRIFLPEGGSNSSFDSAALFAAMNNGGFGGFGNNPLWLILLYPFLMQWGFGGFGNGFGNNNGGAGFLANQLNNDNGRQLIMQAVQGNNQAIAQLAASLNVTHDQLQSGLATINNALTAVGGNVNMTGLQVMNSIAAGNASLASQLASCCCENRLALCNQTNSLNENFNRGFLAIDNKIDMLESNRKDREITALTAKVAQLESQNFTTGVVQQAVSPILGQLAALNSDVQAIKRCQPDMITVPNTQYTAVPTLLANAGADFWASYLANRLTGAIVNGGTTTSPTTSATNS